MKSRQDGCRANVASWIRHTRYRARRLDLDPEACPGLEALLARLRHDAGCVFCGRGRATGFTLLVPLHLGLIGPVPANVVPVCCRCRRSKGFYDVVEWWRRGGISKETLVAVVRSQLGRPGGDRLRRAVSLAVGIVAV